MGNLLIVEDELSIQKILEFELKQAGYQVDITGDGKIGYDMAKANTYDFIILDVMLPGMDGFSICRRLREDGVDSHIMMLSARDDEFDRLQGLDGGADDYMTKPFSTKEVVSKVRAVFRRKEKAVAISPAPQEQENILYYKSLIVDLDKFEVKAGDTPLEFTLKEFELLKFMVKNKGRALSRDLLLDELWGISFYGETRVVDVHVFKLRDKLKPYDIGIKTVRGVGYLLEDDRL